MRGISVMNQWIFDVLKKNSLSRVALFRVATP